MTTIIESEPWLATVALISTIIILVSMGMTVVHLLRGPGLSDRVAALDLTALLLLGAIVLYSLKTGNPMFLDVALVLALLGFLSTIGFARYLEERNKP
ncbi:monovalent cation/H+ antiporter complex subunit F [Acanthopleuribacter pedis]|uniref:Uncharacterized protein n=1 Tax=Acanthopleuribacter pedis TaxID=442870 RepID=A0A8J7QDV9_9BACT|nr:monovalent cation/H+ antiporter complex subunit F [Acanthopleuribacter pedis]MBO1322752.1 hypothetical protein [Acanthopleuribacter pedis]